MALLTEFHKWQKKKGFKDVLSFGTIYAFRNRRTQDEINGSLKQEEGRQK